MAIRRNISLVFAIASPLLLALALSLAPRSQVLETAFAQAVQLEKDGLPGRAADEYLKVLDWEPWRVELWDKSASLAYQAGDWDQAISLYLKMDNLGLLSNAGRTDLGEAFLNKSDWQAAVQAWKPLLENGTASTELYSRTVDLLWKGGDFKAAAQSAALWLKSDPANAQAAYRLGLLTCLDNPQAGLAYLVQAGDADLKLKPAVETLRPAIEKALLEKNPGYQGVMIGRALANLGFWDLARAEFEHATQVVPQYAEGWAYLGEARQHFNQDGLADLQRALQINPQSVVAKGFLALWERRNGKIDEALRLLGEIAAAEPTQAAWQIELGNATVQDGDLVKAYAFFRRATELEPNNPQTWQALADFSLSNLFEVSQVGQPAAQKLLALDPESASGLVLNGRVGLALGDLEAAERFLQQAVEKDATLPEAYFYLGQLYLGQNRMEDARQNLAQAEILAASGSNTQIMARRLLKMNFGGN